jgi:acyl dehydratase
MYAGAKIMSFYTETYTAPPSALLYMLKAFRPSSGWKQDHGFPDLNLIWRGYRIEPEAIRFLQRISGVRDGRSNELLFLLVPHVTGLRLLMAVLTHPLWPLPIWRALQVRNRLSMHRHVKVGDTADLVTEVTAWRVLEKGIEVDLRTRLQQGDDCAWESVVTFYYRGRFGSPTGRGAALGAAPMSPVLDNSSATAERWRIDGTDRWHFGALTGDYNGIHQWDLYARRFGFEAAFPHPQRVAAQCLGRLGSSGSAPRQLDLWIKGPVYFGREVVLRQLSPKNDRQDFALSITGDQRPALVGSLYPLEA